MERHIKAFVSTVSASPLLYLIGLGLSFLLYVVVPAQLFPASIESITLNIGIAIIGLATVLVFWAQGISRKETHLKKPTVADFMQGPYRFTRHPGALGLMLMFVGFVLVTNSIVMTVLLGLLVILETFMFIPTEEKTYLAECPEAYAEYKKRVRMWL